jgi:subtilisin family serine protease
VKRAGSYNAIACGELTVVVGGYAGGVREKRISPYSGGGPLRTPTGQRAGPETLAPSEESRQLPGLRVAGNGNADTVRMNGTSVAAPQVTRLIAAWLAADPTLTLTQIRQRLASASQQPVPPVGTERTAYGWLDC